MVATYDPMDDSTRRQFNDYLSIYRDNQTQLIYSICSHGAEAVPMLEELIMQRRIIGFYMYKKELLRYCVKRHYEKIVRELIYVQNGWFSCEQPCVQTLKSLCMYGSYDLLRDVLPTITLSQKNASELLLHIRFRCERMLCLYLDMFSSLIAPETVCTIIYCSIHCNNSRPNNICIMIERFIDIIRYQYLDCVLKIVLNKGRIDLIEKLLDTYSGTIEYNLCTIHHCIESCCRNGDIDAFKLIIEKAGYDHVIRYFLKRSVYYGDLKIIKTLFKKYGNCLMIDLPMMIYTACLRGDIDLAELLLAYVNLSSIETVHNIIQNNYQEIQGSVETKRALIELGLLAATD